MTSMIDVVFLLLVFFVCASIGQIREATLATELPAGGISAGAPSDEPTPLDTVWLKLREHRGITVAELNGRDYSDVGALLDTLRTLARLDTSIPVVLDIAPDVPLGDVIRVYDACRAAEFQSIRFAADANRLQPAGGG